MALTDDMVANWALQSDFVDVVGANDGVNVGVTFDNVNQHFGDGCAVLDGNDYATIGDVSDLKITGDFSWHSWIKTSSANGTLYSKYGGGNNSTSPHITVGGGKIRIVIDDTGADGFTFRESSVAVDDDNWYEIFCLYKSGGTPTMDIYIGETDGTITLRNGTLFNPPAKTAITDNTSPVRFGASSAATPSNFYVGLMQEQAVWTRVLTGADRTEANNGGAGRNLFLPPSVFDRDANKIIQSDTINKGISHGHTPSKIIQSSQVINKIIKK